VIGILRCRQSGPPACKAKRIRVRLRLKADLKARGSEKPIGVKAGDSFVRRDKTEGDDTDLWDIRRRHTSPLLTLAECADGGALVAIMRVQDKVKRVMKPMDTWSGWHLVADPDNLTDQEWERLQDGTQFLTPAEAAAVEWVSPRRQVPPAMIS